MTTLQLNASQHTKSKRDQLLFNNPERYTWFSNNFQQRRSQKGGPGPGKIKYKIILLLIVAERVFLGGVHLPILFYTFFAEFCIQYLSGFESFNECIKQIQTSQIV